MGGAVSGLLGGDSRGSSSTSVQTVQVPDWLTSRNQGLVDRAETASQQSYTPYDQQRIADFTADTNNAFGITRNTTGQYGDLFTSASNGVYDLISRANGPTSAQIDQHMNPYLDNVLDVSKRNTIEDYNDQQQVRDQEAGMINAFGGSRVAIRQSEADEQLAEQLGDLDYQGRFDAFNNAQNQFNRGTDVLSTGINQSLQTGIQGQQYNQQDITQLLKQGELQRLREQDQLDFNYQEFDRELAYPYENINFLANVLNPLTGAYAGGTTAQTNELNDGGSSTLGNVAGIASSAASLGGLFGFSDERLKENVQQVGELENGLPVYSYNFKGNPKTEIGLIAQEVEQVKPETVVENEDGLKMVNYEEAVKLRDGGPVSSNTASQARLAPVASAGRASFPGVSSAVPSSSGGRGIDAVGLESLIEDFNGSEYSFTEGDGNMLSRLFKGGLDGVDSSNYGSPIGPTLSTNADGFNGLGSSGGGSFLSAFGFKDGGPVESIRDKLDALEEYNMDKNVSSGNSKAVNMVNRTGNAIKNVPTDTINTLLAPVEGIEKGVRAAYPHVRDFLVTPEAEVARNRQVEQEALASSAKADYNEIVNGDNLNDDIASLLGRGNGNVPYNQPQDVVSTDGMDDIIPPKSMEGRPLTVADLKDFDPKNVPALNSSDLQMDESGKVFKANVGPNYRRPINQGNGFVASEGKSTLTDRLPPWITPINKEAGKTKEEPRSKGINMPLLIAGLTMLGTDGDSGDKLLAGLGAGTQAAGDAKRHKLEQAKAQADSKRQEFQDYIAYIKAQAYIEQVQQNASKGDGLTPYQQASIDLKRDKLSLDREKMENKIKGEDNDDPFADLDISNIEDILAEMGN